MIEYFRILKLHIEQVNQMELLIGKLRAKQKDLTERAKVFDNSVVYQNNRLNIIYLTINRLIKNDR